MLAGQILADGADVIAVEPLAAMPGRMGPFLDD
jgi:hypothetical protein